MVKFLLEYGEEPIHPGLGARERHLHALGRLTAEMLVGWAIGRPGLRGALLSVPFGAQRHLLLQALPMLLDPPPWKSHMAFTLLPDQDQDARVPGFALVGVSPEAFTLWRMMAPTAPASWMDLSFPTDSDAQRVRQELGGIIELKQ